MAQLGEHLGPLKRVGGLYYGWWLVGVAALVMTTAIVPVFYGMAAWFPVLESRFAWSRAQISWAFSLTRVEGTVMGPVAGYLIDKMGPRTMVLIGMTTMGAGFLLFSQVHNLWQFYLAFLVMSMGAGVGTWLPVTTVLNNWFVRRRATALSWAMSLSAAAGILLLPLLAWGIEPGDRWRAVAAGIGVLVIVLALPISRVIRNRPEDYGLRPDGGPLGGPESSAAPADTQQSRPAEWGFTWQEAVRTRAFWLITIGHSCSSTVIVTLMVHLGPMLNLDRGLPLQTVGWVVSTYLAVAAVSTLTAGYIGDRVPIRVAIFWFSMIQTVAIVVLLLSNSAPLAFLYAVLAGIGFGGRMPLTTAIRGVYFGRRAFASITGMSMMPQNIFMFALPIFAGYMFDFTGSYNVPFITLAVLSFLGSWLFLLLGDPRPVPPSRRTSI